MTKKSVSRGKKQTNEKKQTQVSSKKLNIKKPATKSKKKTVIPKKGPGKSKPKEPKKAKVKTVNMQTAPESSTETDIHHNSNDLSTKESSGEKGKKEVNSGVVNGPPQTKKKMVDLGPNLDCSESKSESKSEGESGTIIEHKISLQQELKEPEISKTLVNYTESSDTSDDCPKNVEHDLNTDSLNSKDPLISGKLPPDAQPSSDCEEQDDISSQMEKLEGK